MAFSDDICTSVQNKKMFDLAKKQGEVLFIEVASNSIYKPLDIAQAFGDDDKKRHFDIKMLEYDECLGTYAWHYVDVKDVEEKNFSTGNYVLRMPFIEFHTELKPYGYYIAFRLVENGKRSSKFLVANTQDVIERCNIIYKKEYALVPLSEVKEKCKCRLFKEEAFDE